MPRAWIIAPQRRSIVSSKPEDEWALGGEDVHELPKQNLGCASGAPRGAVEDAVILKARLLCEAHHS